MNCHLARVLRDIFHGINETGSVCVPFNDVLNLSLLTEHRVPAVAPSRASYRYIMFEFAYSVYVDVYVYVCVFRAEGRFKDSFPIDSLLCFPPSRSSSDPRPYQVLLLLHPTSIIREHLPPGSSPDLVALISCANPFRSFDELQVQTWSPSPCYFVKYIQQQQ